MRQVHEGKDSVFIGAGLPGTQVTQVPLSRDGTERAEYANEVCENGPIGAPFSFTVNTYVLACTNSLRSLNHYPTHNWFLRFGISPSDHDFRATWWQRLYVLFLAVKQYITCFVRFNRL
jgi:hypothetical protein